MTRAVSSSAPASITRLEDTRVFPPLASLYDWRSTTTATDRRAVRTRNRGRADATLLGNRYNLSHSASERFREGGTFHVLVISGLHISFIGGLVFLVVRRLTKHRLVQFMLPAIVVWAYSIAVGADSSVVRAALMFTFAGFGDDCVSAGQFAECAGCRSPGAAGSQSKRDLRSIVSTDVPVGARDRRDRVAVAVETIGDWRMVSVALDSLSACMLACSKNLLRDPLLARAEMAAGTRALVT